MEQRSTGNGDSNDGSVSRRRGKGGGVRGTRELPVGGLGWSWGGQRRARGGSSSSDGDGDFVPARGWLVEVGGEGVWEDEGDAPELTAVSNRQGNGRREGIDARAKF